MSKMTRLGFLAHLITVTDNDGFPSVNENGTCLYRGPDGKKCVVGHAIPDCCYCPAMDGHGVPSAFTIKQIINTFGEHLLVENISQGEWEQLQSAHDNLAFNASKFPKNQFVKTITEILAK